MQLQPASAQTLATGVKFRRSLVCTVEKKSIAPSNCEGNTLNEQLERFCSGMVRVAGSMVRKSLDKSLSSRTPATKSLDGERGKLHAQGLCFSLVFHVLDAFALPGNTKGSLCQQWEVSRGERVLDRNVHCN